MMSDGEFNQKVSTLKVLIVDDQKNMVRTLDGLVSSIFGFTDRRQHLFKAYNGKDALGILGSQADEQANYIDLVLLDWNMPQMDGVEVLRWIRNSKKPYINEVPVVMISGEAKQRDVRNIVHEGVNSYLIKPFQADDLRSRVLPLLKAYWQDGKLYRACNKRSEVRFIGKKLNLDIRVKYSDGKSTTAKLLDISESGASVNLKSSMGVHVDQLQFASEGEGKWMKIDVLAASWRKQEDPNRIQVSLYLTPKGEQLEHSNSWRVWVQKAKDVERKDRGSF